MKFLYDLKYPIIALHRVVLDNLQITVISIDRRQQGGAVAVHVTVPDRLRVQCI